MKASKLNERYSLNADGTANSTSTAPGTGTGTASNSSTPWYGYIGDWLNGVGSVIGSTKEPGDVNYYNYGSTNGQSNSMLWILAAVAAVVLLVLFTKK